MRHDGVPKPNQQEQQAILDEVQVILLAPDQRRRFDDLLDAEHYLGSGRLVGKQMRYVATYQGQWLALLTWSDAAFHLKDREQWIGWNVRQKKQRLPLVVNNSRFLILKSIRVPNLASRVMKLCLQRLGPDWEKAHGHAVLVAESFVDSQLFRGTCYKASGWTLLGQTKGYGRVRQDYYVAHGQTIADNVRQLQQGLTHAFSPSS